jgi:hypothetical protein
MLWGFMMYAGALNAWHPQLPIWVKVVCIPPLAIFGSFDIAFRLTVGGLLLLDWNIHHGITFSQTLCYYINIKDGSFNYRVACFFAWLLNQFNPGHIS